MRGVAEMLRQTTVLILLMFAVSGTLFALQWGLADLLTLPAGLWAAAWVVGVVASGWLALRRPGSAGRALLILVLALGVSGSVDALTGRSGRIADTVVLLGLATLVPLALLGQRRPGRAGLLLLVLGGTLLLGAMLGDGAPGVGSTALVVVPALVASAMLLVAGRLGRCDAADTGSRSSSASTT